MKIFQAAGLVVPCGQTDTQIRRPDKAYSSFSHILRKRVRKPIS